MSYWQNGSNQPERPPSLAAVAVLEEILGRPPGGLAGLIGSRRPRGRWTPRTSGAPVTADKLWKQPEALVRALAKIGATPEDLNHPLKVSQNLAYRIDDNGFEESVRVRRVVQADRNNTTRILFATRCSTLPQPPMVVFADGCQPARFRADVPTSTCVFEFMLDKPLQAGDLAAVEFGLRFPPGQTDQHAELAIYRPMRDLILQVTFHPKRMPVRCYSYWQPRSTLPIQEQQVATLDGQDHRFQFIALDPAPGQYGIAWSWT